MRQARRSFLRTTLGLGALAAVSRAEGEEPRRLTREELVRISEAPVLKVDELSSPVTIASMELLRNGRNFVVRVRSTSGDEGLAIPNAMRLIDSYPIFLRRVAPFFIGKDARQLEPLLWELYRHEDNYKFQGLALWVCVAAAEFAILDLLGQRTGKSIGDLMEATVPGCFEIATKTVPLSAVEETWPTAGNRPRIVFKVA